MSFKLMRDFQTDGAGDDLMNWGRLISWFISASARPPGSALTVPEWVLHAQSRGFLTSSHLKQAVMPALCFPDIPPGHSLLLPIPLQKGLTLSSYR